jgi:hypothetical protein
MHLIFFLYFKNLRNLNTTWVLFDHALAEIEKVASHVPRAIHVAMIKKKGV